MPTACAQCRGQSIQPTRGSNPGPPFASSGFLRIHLFLVHSQFFLFKKFFALKPDQVLFSLKWAR